MNNQIFTKQHLELFGNPTEPEYWCNVYLGHYIAAPRTKSQAEQIAMMNRKGGTPVLYRIHVKFKKLLQDTNGAQRQPLH